MEKLIHIDDLTRICGFSTGETSVNNGYGCKHPNCEESEIIKMDDPYSRPDSEKFRWKLIKIALRKKYGPWSNIVLRLKDIDGKEYLDKLRYDLLYDDNFLKQFGCKRMGKCYCFSCPLGSEADSEDFKRFGEDPESMSEGEWLVVDEEELIHV